MYINFSFEDWMIQIIDKNIQNTENVIYMNKWLRSLILQELFSYHPPNEIKPIYLGYNLKVIYRA